MNSARPDMQQSNAAKKLKIIRIISRLNIGGPVIHVTLLTKHFAAQGYQSLLITGFPSENEGDMGYLAEEYGVKPLFIKGFGREISFLSDLRIILMLAKMFLREKPDIVHTHTAKAGTVGRLAAILTGVPQVYHTFHGNVFKGYFSPLKTQVFIWIERVLALFTTQIVAISEAQKKELLSFKIAPAKRITVIPLGFDFQRILPNDPTQSLRAKYGIAPDKLVIATIGRLTAIKNQSMFVDIVAQLASRYPQLHFMLIGDGELRAELEEKVRAAGIASRVTFTGFIADLKLIYGSVDIVLLTSINEGTPVSLLEAMASQKLVISTDVGGVSDVIKHGTTGFIANDAKQFVNIIEDLLANPDKYRDIPLKAREFVIGKYDQSRLFADIEALYGLQRTNPK